jgi:NAD-dependent dihydropyrimidine dehydrogenase PreA subunit
MNQIDQVLQEKERKSTVWSGISRKARGENVTITLNEEFCKGREICVEICPNKCLEMKGGYRMVKIPRGTERLNSSALEAGIELALEAYDKVPPNAAYVGDKVQGLGKDFDV